MNILRTKFCVIGTGAGGGMVAYALAKAGADVLVVNSGRLPGPNEFQNELTPQQRGDFEIRRDTRFPVKPGMLDGHPLLADEQSRSSVPSQDFTHVQIHHVNGLQNLWNGISLRYSQDDFSNRNSYNAECVWPITYSDLSPHYAQTESLAHVVGYPDHLPQFPDGIHDAPEKMRQIDRLFIESNRHLFGSDLYYFASRKAIDLRSDSPQVCARCGHCTRGCRSNSVYKFSAHLLPQIQHLKNFRMIENLRVIKIIPSSDKDGLGNTRIQEIHAVEESHAEMVHIQADVFILCTGAIETPRLLLNSFAESRIPTDQVGVYLQDGTQTTMATSLMRLWLQLRPDNRGYGEHLLFGGMLPNSGGPFPFVAHILSDFIRVPDYLGDLQQLPIFLRRFIAKQIYKSTMGLILWAPAIPEQANRVVLSDEKDRFSQRKAKINYRIGQTEIGWIEKLDQLGRKMVRNASGYIIEKSAPQAGRGVHYAGTCRMAPTPDKGVVDKNLKYFGTSNLYVCDGSVIPALSEKHPTLTIMALAHRLSAHLQETHS